MSAKIREALNKIGNICAYVAEAMQGPRVALACSETVPSGSVMEFEIMILNEVFVDYVKEALDYGALRGFGQWRNSGKGTFSYEII